MFSTTTRSALIVALLSSFTLVLGAGEKNITVTNTDDSITVRSHLRIQSVFWSIIYMCYLVYRDYSQRRQHLQNRRQRVGCWWPTRML